MKIKIYWVIVLTLLITFMVVSCSKDIDEHPINRGENDTQIMEQPDMSINLVDKEATHSLARYVHSVVSGEIKPDDLIRVKFMSPMVSEDQLNKEIKDKLFAFKPAIKGKTYWEQKDLLVFEPEKSMKQREDYQGELDINSIIDSDIKVQPLNFTFFIMGMELRKFEANFDKDGDGLIYTGEIGFTLPVSGKDLEKSFVVYLDNVPLEVYWEKSTKAGFFRFKTELIKQEEQQKKVKLRIKKGKINIPEDYERIQTIASLREMAVMRVSKLVEGDNPTLEMEFSETIAEDQDIDNYIVINPYLKTTIQRFQNKIIVSGDFEFGNSYNVFVKAGIRNEWGEKLAEDFVRKIVFSDQKPRIMFSQDGAFMPSDLNQIITFRTLNLKSVRIKIKKVFDNNLIYFLQSGSYESDRTNTDYYYYSMDRVGEQVINRRLEIGFEKNKWLQHEIDLSNIIEENDKGLYFISLNFGKEDILYKGPQIDNSRNSWYTNPYSYGYYNRNGTIYKPIVISDLGVTVKQSEKENIVFVNNILTTEPVGGANVKLFTYNNQEISSGKTDNDGMVRLAFGEKTPYFIVAQYKGQRSIIKTNEMQWNLSTFDVDGVMGGDNKTRMFLYTERGVYRPGDPINISIILRNESGTFPKNHPVNISIINPRNQQIFDRVLNNSKDGFYHLEYQTDSSDPTGNWKIKLVAAGRTFYHDLKIETVVAERLKVNIEPEKDKIDWDDNEVIINLKGKYLFGNPTANLDAKLVGEMIAIPKEFKQSKWNNYNFIDQTINFEAKEIELFNGKLDAQGETAINWEIPDEINVPSAIIVKFEGEIMESGGRSSKSKYYLPYNPYEHYIGIESSSKNWSKIGQKSDFNIIILNDQGRAIPGKDITVKIYRNRNYWWWQYDQRNDSQLRYKTDVETELLKEFKLISSTDAQTISFTPDVWGQYLIEAVIEGDKQHSSSRFFYASYWGRMDGGMKNAGLLTVKSDKQNYKIGEKAVLSFPIPQKSNSIITLEKSDRVIDQFLYQGKNKDNQGSIEIEVTREMLPNIYCSVSVLQPHSQTENDRPVRMFGVIPINVFDSNTREGIVLTVPDTLKPNRRFTCRLQTENKSQTQFTIAVVDEGLLSLTNFSSPNAWNEFYKKIRLAVKTFDNYSYFLGVNKGDIFKRFSIGGGMAFRNWQKKELAPDESKRFEPVSMFKGPLETDENGYAEVEFEMPDYVGAVRVMVVSANAERYGNIDRTVIVKKDLMILPTLPRALSPNDEFTIPVDVFVASKIIKKVNLSLETDDFIEIISANNQVLNFDEPGQKMVKFKVKTNKKVGNSHVKIIAKSNGEEAVSEIEIGVNPSSPRIYNSKKYEITTGKSLKIQIPFDGIPGTNEAQLAILRHQKLDLTKRANFLNNYPYGCVEQTISAVFPQLYLGQLLSPEAYTAGVTADNINMAVKRLRKFQLPNGGLSYWPGSRKISEWSTCYATHFLLEAESEGYFVPGDFLGQLTKYLKSVTLKDNNRSFLKDNHSNRMVQLYRIYVLALMNKAEISAMNFLQEEFLNTFNDTERWMLASSYSLAGMQTTADEIIRGTGVLVRDYSELGGSFGSSLRDKAIILSSAVDCGAENIADQLYESITEVLTSNSWYNTQTIGYSLLALGKYIKAHPKYFNDSPIKGEVVFDSEEVESFILKKTTQNFDLAGHEEESITINVEDNPDVEKIFTSLNWSGVPLKPADEKIVQGIHLNIHYEDDKGNHLDPTELTQGTVFTQIIEVYTPETFWLENIALVQLLPSGWEVENDRIDPDQYGDNGSNYNTPEYTDIRDDRVLSFFDLVPKQKVIVRNNLRAVTVGHFTLPPTKCETMYSDNYKAVEPGKKVSVIAK